MKLLNVSDRKSENGRSNENNEILFVVKSFRDEAKALEIIYRKDLISNKLTHFILKQKLKQNF